VTPPAPAVSRPAPAETYGPIQRGETMNKIAGELRPDGVTHEQMLMALFRSNPDAFIRKNVNLVMAGKILRVPDKAEVAAIPHPEAIKEFRAQVVEWNSFRQRVAEAAGREPDARTTAGGKITTRVDDAAADAPKDVVRLSKGEPPGVAAGAGDKRRSVAERVRTLEEEVVTREKALAEANERIVQLEMTIKDMQRLVEIKSPTMAAAQKQAAAKVEPAPKPKPAAPPEKTAMAPTQPAPMAEPPKPKPRVVPPPPLPGYDDLMNTVMDNLPLIAGGSVVLLGGLYFGLARRRRSRAPGWDKPNGVAPTLDDAAWSSPGDETMAGEPPAARSSGDDVDPLAEAEVYVAYGRDAQAEEILKEAMAKEPSRPDIQVKLLEIYSARKDKSAFSRVAQSLSRVTGGQGNDWHKVAAIGYTLDPGNPLFASGRGAAASMPPGGPTSSDFNVNLGTTSRDGKPADVVTFDEYADSDAQKQPMVEPTIRRAGHKSEAPASREPDIAIDQPQAGAMTTDIAFDVPETGRATVADIALDSEDAEKRKSGGHDIDFNLELPKIDEVPTQPVAADAPGTDQRGGDRESDFKLDLGDINLNLDDRGHAFGQDSAGADRDKDTQWYDVQTKFDLAKAYQEMGDKDGAKEILLEVIREGDPEQKVAAKNLLETLA
jgi:pilus assembly protein FimV